MPRKSATTTVEVDSVDGVITETLRLGGPPNGEAVEPVEPIVTNLDASPEPIQSEPAPPTPEAKQLAEIIKLNSEVCRLHDDYLVSAETAKTDKKLWEAASERLQSFIRGTAETYPLFPGKPPETEPEAQNEDWREIAIDILETHGLSAAIVSRLSEEGFHTIGALAHWTSGGNGELPQHLTDVPGIGEAKAEQIGAALELFWAAQGIAD